MATCHARPRSHIAFSNITTSGGPFPGLPHWRCRPPSSQHTEGILGIAHASARLLRPRLLLQHWAPLADFDDAPGPCLYQNRPKPFNISSFSLAVICPPRLTSYFPRLPPPCVAASSSAHLFLVSSKSLSAPAVSLLPPSSCANSPLPRSSLQAGQLRNASSLALGLSGTRTALQPAVQRPAGWDGE